MANILYDNFTGGTIDTTKWTVITGTGTVVQQNGRLEVTGQGAWNANGVISKQKFVRGVNNSVSVRAQYPSSGVNLLVVLQASSSSLNFSDSKSISGYFNSSDQFIVYSGGSGSSPLASVSAGVWYTVKFEFDGGSGGFKVYLDGSLVWTGSSDPNTDYYLSFNGLGPVFYLDDVYYEAVVALSFFRQSTVGDGTSVASYCDSSALITAIQGNGVDSYFDTTADVRKVYVYYTHVDGRQQTKIVHTVDGTDLTGPALWNVGARDGAWQKSKIVAFNNDGAQSVLTRPMIGSSEDCTHSGGLMNLV